MSALEAWLGNLSRAHHVSRSGTGVCAIYALIGCALDARWSFTGTDIDAVSLEHARKIIQDPRNAHHELDRRIQLMLRDPLDALIPTAAAAESGTLSEMPMYHVTMCNPPFYASQEEMQESAELKEDGPSAVGVAALRALFSC